VANVYYDKDTDMSSLSGKTVAVIGYGSQGHAHALNLHDSGVSVIVGLYEGSRSWAKAEADGLTVMTTADATKAADILMLALPDTKQGKIYQENIKPHLSEGMTLMFCHGFNILYGQIIPPANVDVSLLAPKSPGHRVREVYVDGVGTPGLVAVHQDYTGNAMATALAYGNAVGCTRAGVIETTFKEETETDLFGEQAVLCGGASALVQAGFETLVEAGYQPEIAYFECLHELKLIVDLMYEGGLSYMRYSISNTTEWGDYVAGPRIVNDETRATMKQLLAEIQSGAFAEDWIDENNNGLPRFKQSRAAGHGSKLEAVGSQLREMMPFLDNKEIKQS